jgi:hypothetical protein
VYSILEYSVWYACLSAWPWLFLAENIDTLVWIRVSGKQGPLQSSPPQLSPFSLDYGVPVGPCSSLLFHLSHVSHHSHCHSPAPNCQDPDLSLLIPAWTPAEIATCQIMARPKRIPGFPILLAPLHLTHPVPLSGPITGLTGGESETRGSWRTLCRPSGNPFVRHPKYSRATIQAG